MANLSVFVLTFTQEAPDCNISFFRQLIVLLKAVKEYLMLKLQRRESDGEATKRKMLACRTALLSAILPEMPAET